MSAGRKLGLSALSVATTLVVASAVFPVAAILSRLYYVPTSQAYWTGGGAISAYWTYWQGIAQAHEPLGWFKLFWLMLEDWWHGYDPYGALGERLAASLLAGALAAFGLIAWAVANAKPDTKTERTYVRGAKLVERTEAPKFVHKLVLREIELSGGWVAAWRARWTLWLYGPRGDQFNAKAVLADAKVQPREITKAEAQADAEVMKTAQLAADEFGMVRMAGIPMPYSSETLHTLIAASPGTGKTVALRQLLTDLRRRGDRVICVDAGYDLSPTFQQPGDLILSPVDPKSAGWSLRNEVRDPSEWGSLLKSVIPAQNGPAGVWRRKAQDFMTSICKAVGTDVDNRKLLEIATVWSTEQLLELLAGTPAAVALGDGGEEYLTSVRSNIGECLSGWEDGPDGDFSVRRYMNATNDKHWLWLPYSDLKASTCQPAIAGWIDIMINAATERRDAGGQPGGHRTWIIIDELNSMGLIPNLDKLGARLRKYDICGVGIIQDDAQLKSTYGVYDAETIFSTFSNKAYFRCSSASLAERISRDLGMSEYKEIRHSASKSRSNGKTTENVSVSEQYVKRELFLPSEIQNLPTRTGVVKFAETDTVIPTYLWVPPRSRK